MIVYVLGFWLYGCFCKPSRALVIFYVLVLWLFVFWGVLLSLDKFMLWSFVLLVSAGILAQQHKQPRLAVLSTLHSSNDAPAGNARCIIRGASSNATRHATRHVTSNAKLVPRWRYEYACKCLWQSLTGATRKKCG